MLLTNNIHIPRYSPNRADPEHLKKIHVQRDELLSETVSAYRQSALTESKFHRLFVGPRGSGKTHLITLITYELRQQGDLANDLRIAWLSEDETSTTFLELLIRIYNALANDYPSEFPLSILESIYEEEIGHSKQKALDYRRKNASNFLEEKLLKQIGKRKVLVLIENLDSLFKNFEEGEGLNWRAFIQNSGKFSTAATAQSLVDDLSKRDKPFFGFFQIIHLEPLTFEETVHLFQKIARLNDNLDLLKYLETSKGRARVHAIHHLSGGNHRLHIALSDFLQESTLEGLIKPFDALIDDLTPFYQERMRWLSTQQKKIVEFLCRQGSPIAVKNIADRLMISENTLSNQLKELKELGYVISNRWARESMYELAEPLMRLTMQVKDNHGREPLRLVVDFLRVWYDKKELEEGEISSTGEEYYRKHFFMARALEEDTCLRNQILSTEFFQMVLTRVDDNQFEMIRNLAIETEAPQDRLSYAKALMARNQTADAGSQLAKVIEDSKSSVEIRAESLEKRAFLAIGDKKFKQAFADCNRVLELDELSNEQVASALITRAFCSLESGNVSDVQKDCKRAIELSDISNDQMARALVVQAQGLEKLGDSENAMSLLNRSLHLSGTSDENRAIALIKRGFLYQRRRLLEKSIADLDEAISLAKVSIKALAEAFFRRGRAHMELNHSEMALADFEHVVKMNDAPTSQVIDTLVLRGFYYGESGRSQEAICDFSRVINEGNASVYQLGFCLIGRAIGYLFTRRLNDSLSDIRRLIEFCSGEPRLNEKVTRDLQLLISSLFEADSWDEAIEVLKLCSTAVNRKDVGTVPLTIIACIFRKITSPETWQARAKEVLSLFEQAGCSTYLGFALVAHLKVLEKSPLSSGGFEQWFIGWADAAKDIPSMEIPLRLLRIGIDYIKTNPRSETALLGLPLEEREILKQVFGLTKAED